MSYTKEQIEKYKDIHNADSIIEYLHSQYNTEFAHE